MIDIDQLYTTARDLTDLLPRVHALIPHPTNAAVDDTHTGARRTTVHNIPWNTPAASLYFDVHADTRRYETALTLLLWHHAKYRSPSDTDTLDAVARLPVLIDHALNTGHQDHGDVADAARLLPRWARQARAILDETRDDERPWTTAPGDLRCPHCETRLKLAPGWSEHPDSADVHCRTCRDDHGQYLRWPPSAWVLTLQYRDAG